MKCAFATVISFPLLWAASTASAEGMLKGKWCEPVTLTGKVEQRLEKHPFNGGKFPVMTLVLKQPIEIAAGECDGIDLGRAKTKKVQLFDVDLKKFQGKTITVSGQLMAPGTPYHVRPAWLFQPVVKPE